MCKGIEGWEGRRDWGRGGETGGGEGGLGEGRGDWGGGTGEGRGGREGGLGEGREGGLGEGRGDWGGCAWKPEDLMLSVTLYPLPHTHHPHLHSIPVLFTCSCSTNSGGDSFGDRYGHIHKSRTRFSRGSHSIVSCKLKLVSLLIEVHRPRAITSGVHE